jgi:hypothetical protein
MLADSTRQVLKLPPVDPDRIFPAGLRHSSDISLRSFALLQSASDTAQGTKHLGARRGKTRCAYVSEQLVAKGRSVMNAITLAT